jgi:rsbT co-antagonist protein RsbR
MAKKQDRLMTTLNAASSDLLTSWLTGLRAANPGGDARQTDDELRKEATEFLRRLQKVDAGADVDNVESAAWQDVRAFLDDLSRARAVQGFSSADTAIFVFSLKRPIFEQLRKAAGSNAEELADEVWRATRLIDALGLHTVKAFQMSREQIIARQQEELLELSTPVVKLWDGILALPMIGTLDSARTQVVMESLLQRIVETSAELAIIDITGVPTVDTLVAQHLLKTVTAIRLMGADCIISGIRPQIAQTIVHLGVDLQGVITKATLADALSLGLRRLGYAVAKQG